MKKLLIILAILLPTLGKAQTRPVYYYDSLGNEYHYDPTTVIVKEKKVKPSHKKRKTVIRITPSGRRIRYFIEY